jgi:hypothetical protein
MDTIAKDAGVKRHTIDADTQKVDVMLTTTRPNVGTVQCHWTLDFSNCTDVQVLELAKRSVVITLQSRFRRADNADADTMVNMDVDVADELKRETRAKMTPERVAKYADTLDDAAKLALIDKLQAAMDVANVTDDTSD